MKIYTFNMSEVELCTQPLGVHSLSTFYYKTLWLLISSDLIIIRCIDKEWWKYIYIMLKYIFTMSKVELWTQPLDVTSLSTFLLGVCGVWWWKYIYNMSKYIFIMSEMELCVQHFDVTSLSVFCWVGVGYYVCFLLHSF